MAPLSERQTMMTPARVAFVVEYPGYLRDVNDTSGLLRTLGGEEHLAEAFVDVDQVTSKVSTSSTAVLQQDKKVELELRYRPDDLCSHPIQGVVLPYRGVLMRLKWRRRRGVANAPRELYSMEPMCTLNKVGRFREMADFQVCVDQSAAVPTLMRNLTTGNLASVLDFTGLPADEEEDMQPLAPLYSHIQVPLKYDFKQNTGVEKQGERYVHRDHLNKLAEAPNVRFSDRELPSGPPVGLSPAPADLDVKLRKMFDERPIWTRIAVVQTLGIVNTPEVRILLLNYGYFQMNGPWRSCYIRYGYDPRKDSEARRYQILDFRTNPLTRPVMGVRATKPAFVPLNRPAVKIKFTGAFGTEESLGAQMATMYQLCDIEEPSLAALIDFDVADGWYYHYHLNTIRVLLKHIVGELYKKEEQLNEMTGDQKPAEIHFELDSVTRASLEGQLLKSITAMCKQENADPNVIEARLDQLMGSITAKTSNASDNVTPMLTTMAAEMAAAAEDEDKENAAAEDSEDLEYDLFGDD